MKNVYETLRDLINELEQMEKKAAQDELEIESLTYQLENMEIERDRYKEFYDAVHKEALK